MGFPKYLQENISSTTTYPARPSQLTSFPDEIHPFLRKALKNNGIDSLYSHQLETWQIVRSGNHCIVATGTSSGKTLCYLLPILQKSLEIPNSSALLLYPTRALANDQHENINGFLNHLSPSQLDDGKELNSGIYDGDTNEYSRKALREKADFILTNPDMLHVGILPHHTRWERFFSSLQYIVIDEVHTYRGVFGSHLANVIRRIKRITHFYQSDPVFIFSSATIGNPKELAQSLLEEPVQLVEKDGSHRAEQQIIFYNPPLIDQRLGIRAGMLSEATSWIDYLIDSNLQSIFFVRSRRAVELLLRKLNKEMDATHKNIKSYRSGYLTATRRQTEKELRSGSANCVISTNALELGIDIGQVDIVGILGYPGSIASLKQQAGRAGRKDRRGMGIFIASSLPIDQFLIRNPKFIDQQPIEKAFLDANNPFILINHLKCACFELPFHSGETFGSLPWSSLSVYLESLESKGMIQFINENSFWTSVSYPAAEISLRTILNNEIVLIACNEKNGELIGKVDFASALWMVHPGAVYLQEGNSYFVQNLDLINSEAQLVKTELPYYTEPQIKSNLVDLETIDSNNNKNYSLGFGDIEIETTIPGFKKILWDTSEIIGAEKLDLPTSILKTKSSWLKIHPDVIQSLCALNAWQNDTNEYGSGWGKLSLSIKARDGYICQSCNKKESSISFHVHHIKPFRAFSNADEANQTMNLITLCPTCHHLAEQNIRLRSGLTALSYTMHHLVPLLLLCDYQDIGVLCDGEINLLDHAAGILFFDRFPGGIGLCSDLYPQIPELLALSKELILACDCSGGCPACVGPAGENGISGKNDCLTLLEMITSGL